MELSKENIEEVITGALEGGSNYWFYLPDKSIMEIRKLVSKLENPYLSEAIVEVVLKGGKISIFDIEDTNELLGTLSKENIDLGVKKLIEDGRDEIYTLKMGNGDVETYDVLFQYFIMGELIFG